MPRLRQLLKPSPWSPDHGPSQRRRCAQPVRFGHQRTDRGLRRELFQLRFQQATRQLANTHRFKEVRIKLAQLLTVQSERQRSTAS